jgi:hypothetical protein
LFICPMLILFSLKMKLSTSLIVLCGNALADYACCPYDAFGVVDTACDLTEKTPWSTDADGHSENACKAWEANVDASFDGSYDQDDWGCCGFQRHFSWRESNSAHGVDSTAYAEFNINTGGATYATNIFAEPAGNRENHPLGPGPTLGGICKLFVPVYYEHIKYVTIAGVHFRGGGWGGTGGRTLASLPNMGETTSTEDVGQATPNGAATSVANANANSVFDARVGNGANYMGGTAYCFTVANPGECMTNNNGVHNGNVAGQGYDLSVLAGLDSVHHTWDNDNPSVQQDPENRDPSTAMTAYGMRCVPSTNIDEDEADDPWDAANNKGFNIVETGPNFDVVVHFRTEWCMAHWTFVNMQLPGDHGNLNVADYNLDGSNPNPHAHTDVADKRFDANCNGHSSGPTGSGTPINTFVPTNGDLWPNAGAWAGYYSFVTCSGSDNGVDFNPIWSDTVADHPRYLVISNFNMDYRHDSEQDNVCIRGNVRQIGAAVFFCNPGSFSASGRCTWNWNFADQMDAFQNEQGFENFNDPSSRSSASTDGTNPSNPTVADYIIHVYLRGPGSATLNDAVFPTGATCHSDAPHSACANSNNGEFAITLSCTTAGGVNERDGFPLCFMGDEVHFQVTRPQDTKNIDFVQGMFSGVNNVAP